MFINENLRQLIASTVKAFGGNCDIDIISGYDVLINDEKLTDDFIKITRAMLGAKRVLSNIRPSMIAEDFSFYAKQVPGTYFFLGCTCQYPLHSNLFVPDERCTKVGIKVIANFILNYFK